MNWTIFQRIFELSKMSIFVFDDKFKLIKSFKQPLSPDFPTIKARNAYNKVPFGEIRLSIIKNDSIYTAFHTSTGIVILWYNSKIVESVRSYSRISSNFNFGPILSFSEILYYTIFNKEAVVNRPDYMDDMPNTDDGDFQKLFSQRDSNQFHKNYRREKLMLQAITNGSFPELHYRMNELLQTGAFGVMVPGNELRTKKDLLISSLTLMTRAAIEGGVYPETAYTLSDNYSAKIENLTSIVNFVDILREIAELFTSQVIASNKESKNHTIFTVQDYIYKNLSSPISLDELSAYVGYSKNYLCKYFKTEYGKTINQYLNQVRIDEAKNYLLFTNQSLDQIAVSVGYKNASYFSKVFSKSVKQSPSKYREFYHFN